jgi:ribose-phosphate pyrophosphokinase
MKYCLNLDKNFQPVEAESINFDLFQFSGGEVHIKILDILDGIGSVFITHRIVNSANLIEVLLAKDALERIGFKEINLIIPYIPYARQDRQCAYGESLSLKVFAHIINEAKFNKVIVLDAHSDVAPALINNCINDSNDVYVNLACEHIAYYDNADILLVSPDAGANKKTNKLFENIEIFSGLVKCDKNRNVNNGSLANFEVFANDLQGKPCLIVDDICDGGRTFIGLAKELKNKNAGNIYLFVTHGIFSNGYDELLKYFNTIFTTNSFKDIENNSCIKQFKLKIYDYKH